MCVCLLVGFVFFFFVKQKTAYEMRISDWSSDVCSSDLKILPERALEITSGVLSALDYSHRAGIIHRDIKPANVMLPPGGDVKVMDFGIARAVPAASSTRTQSAAAVGTATYTSPEQALRAHAASRSPASHPARLPDTRLHG